MKNNKWKQEDEEKLHIKAVKYWMLVGIVIKGEFGIIKVLCNYNFAT